MPFVRGESPGRVRPLLVWGAASVVVHGGLAIHSGSEHGPGWNLGALLIAHALLFSFYGLAVRSVLACETSSGNSRWFWPILLGTALLIRVVAMAGEPLFENDHHRYLWDGKVTTSGVNPYFYPPESVFLEDLRDSNWESVAFPEVSTIYPPLSQFLFAASWAIGGAELWVWKLFVLALDLGIIALLIGLLRRLALPTPWALIYAWNPLVIKEFANSAHVDALAVFWTTAFIAAWVASRRSWSAVFLGLAIASKLYPLVLVPLTLRSFRIRDHALWLVTVALCYLPFSDAGELLFEGLGVYVAQWEFNDSLFVGLRALAVLVARAEPEASYFIAKCVAAGIVLAVGLTLSGRIPGHPHEIPRASLIVLGSLCLLSPTLDPWYLTWIAPLLCLRPHLAWLILCGTVTLSYAYWWQERDLWWIRPLEYTPFFLLLILPIYRAAAGRRLETRQDAPCTAA